jgi:glycerophosphoryl diester phosphodiesterase
VHDLDDLALARRYAPVLRFDGHEPFLPAYAGYTVFRASGASPSFPRYVKLDAPAAVAVEYALWWDWDIQHLYELEHAWVLADAAGAIVGLQSSQHGAATGEGLRLEDGRPVLYAEPGKHALTVSREELLARRPGTERACGVGAGRGGVWVTPLYRGRIARTPDADQLVRTYLRDRAFEPAWDWSRRVDVAELPLMPWPLLDTAIPRIVAARLAELDDTLPRDRRHVLHIGHRGAAGHAPENTLAAIRKAAELGAHMVELDVRLSADGVPVLSHDSAVAAEGDGTTPINTLSAVELGRTGAEPETSVPTLRAALDLCAQLGLGPYLEIKERAAIEPLLDELAARDLARFSVVGSFEPAWVARVTDRAPHIPTSILFGAFDVDPVALARGCGATYVHPCWERHPAPHTLLDDTWLAAVRRAGLGVICWHEERPDVLAALLRLGIAGICTDRLDLLSAAAHSQLH